MPGGIVPENSHWIEVIVSLLWTVANLEVQNFGAVVFSHQFPPSEHPYGTLEKAVFCGLIPETRKEASISPPSLYPKYTLTLLFVVEL